MLDYLKRWNWTAFLAMMCVCLVGAIANSNYITFKDQMLLGIVSGLFLGLIIAWITMEPK